MPTNVTLDNVAHAAGVSKATASRALNDKDGVSPEVRERVRSVADELGYRPNRAARNLAGGKASVLGLLLGVGYLRPNLWGSATLESFVYQADDLDEGLMVIGDARAPNVTVRNLIRDGLLDGIIISTVALRLGWIEELLDAQLPIVLLGVHPRRIDVHVVEVENRQSSRTMVEHMLDAGCERVAIVVGKMDRADANARFEGWCEAHTARGLSIDPSLIFTGDFSYESGYGCTEAILKSRPDGVFCSNDLMGLGLGKGLIEAGVSIPDDISLAGFDGLAHRYGYELDGKSLTSVEQPFDLLARQAIRAARELAEGGQPELELFIAPELHWGRTTRPRS